MSGVASSNGQRAAALEAMNEVPRTPFIAGRFRDRRDGDGLPVIDPSTGPPSGRCHVLEEMAWPAVDALDRERTVFFIHGGPVEQHGPHLPLGTDIAAAAHIQREMVRLVLRRGRDCVVAPAVTYGTAKLSADYPGSTSVRRSVLTDFLEDVLASFARAGFRHLVTTSQHIDPPYIRAWEVACERVNSAFGARAIHGYERFVLEDVLTGTLSEFAGCDMRGDSHAGTFETAVVRYLAPRLVDDQVVAELKPNPLDFRRDLQSASSFRELADGRGYTGDPSAGTPQLGRRLMRRYADAYGDVLCRYLAGEDVSDELSIGPLREVAGETQHD